MRCPECGARNLPEATECVACAHVLSRDEEDVDPLIGQTIDGRYTLTSILGEGSMGVVYAATQEGLDHEVAVKVLHEHVAADPKVKKRFHREARMTSRLSHPNTVRIFDFGRSEEGMLYLVMELLDGPDLLDVLLDDDPLPPGRIVGILEQVLLALDEAHDQGIVHRDLKPENVMVVEDHQGREQVKVCDFGIAKLVEAEGSAITVTGFVCGTPEYMAPEQARGEELDPRADVYALGCLLYRMLTGVVPFQGASALATITEHLTKPLVRPRLRAPERGIPKPLERVCLRALARDPEERYPDATSMRAALRSALETIGPIADDPLGTHPDRPSIAPAQRLRPAWIVPAALVAIVGGVGLGWWLLGREAAPEIEEGTAGVQEATTAGPPAEPPSLASPSLDGGAPVPVAPTPEPSDEPEMAESDETPPVGPPGAEPATTTRRASAGAPRRLATPMETTMAGDGGYREHFEEGRRRFLANDVRGAITAFEEAARLAPAQPPVHKELGRAYMRAGQVGAARRAYRRYLQLAPDAADRAIVERLIEGVSE